MNLATLQHRKSNVLQQRLVAQLVEFPQKAPLLGVFCVLICFLLSEQNCFPAPWCLNTPDILKPACLFHNCIQFNIPGYHGSVVLIEAVKRFECHVSLPELLFSRHSKTLCSFITRALDKGLQLPRSQHSFGIQQLTIQHYTPLPLW